MLRAAYVFPYIVVSLKKDFIGNAVQCWNKYKFLSLEPQDEEGAFIGSEMRQTSKFTWNEVDKWYNFTVSFISE